MCFVHYFRAQKPTVRREELRPAMEDFDDNMNDEPQRKRLRGSDEKGQTGNKIFGANIDGVVGDSASNDVNLVAGMPMKIAANDIEYRRFEAIDKTPADVGWSQEAVNATSFVFKPNGRDLEFRFDSGTGRYVFSATSYLSFEIGFFDAAGARVFPQHDDAVFGCGNAVGLFRDIELYGRDGQLIDRNPNPGLVRVIQSMSVDDDLKPWTEGANDVHGSGRNGTGNSLFERRRFIVPLSHMLGVFASKSLFSPMLLDGARLRCRLVDSFVSAISAVPFDDNGYARTSGLRSTYEGIPDGNLGYTRPLGSTFAHPVFNFTQELIIRNTDRISIEANSQLVLDACKIDPKVHASAVKLFEASGLSLTFKSFDEIVRQAPFEEFGASEVDVQIPRSFGASLTCYVKLAQVGINPHFDSYNERLVRTFALGRVGSPVQPAYTQASGLWLGPSSRAPVSEEDVRWRLGSVQVVHGNVRMPERALTNAWDAAWQWRVATGCAHRPTSETFLQKFMGFDAAAFALATNNVPGAVVGGGAQPVDFDSQITVRIRTLAPTAHFSIAGDPFDAATTQYLHVLVEFLRSVNISPMGTDLLF